jgi:TonB family protein
MQKASIRRKKRSTKRLPDPDAPRAPQYDSLAPELMREYLNAAIDRKDLKVAAIWTLVFHFLLFWIVIPTARVEPIPLTNQMATTIVKRYQPPAPPSRPKKSVKKKTNPIPIPDPTPDDPEPLIDEESEVEFDDPDADWDVGLPNAPPGPRGARDGAVAMGSGGLIAPVQILTVLPEYTPSATRNGVQGDVYIEAVVMEDGTVTDPKLIRGLPDEELNQRALDAIVKWTFKPGLKDGKPVPVIALFTVTFRIH